MTVEEKRVAIERYCKNNNITCRTCKLGNKKGCFSNRVSDEQIEQNYILLFGPEVTNETEVVDKPEAADERGANNMEKQTITIDLERYEELVKKEVIYDTLTFDSDVNMYLVPRLLEEVKTNA